MEESYETFEELNPTRPDPVPHKPARATRRPEMFASRRTREEDPPVQQQPRAEPRSLPREPGGSPSLQEPSSTQNTTHIETPWENVTLNRCLFVAITILVLTSGFQRLNETLRGHRAAEDEEAAGLAMRRPGSLRHRGQTLEPDTSLWDVMFSWLPDFDDEDDDEEDEEEDDDDDDDDGELKRRKIKQSRETGASSSLRNKPLPDKKLMKRRDRRAKKDKRDRKDRKEEEPEEEDDGGEEEEHGEGGEEEEDGEMVPRKIKKQKNEKKSQKG